MADDFDFIDRFGSVFLDSFFVVDRERRICKFNPAFAEMLGIRIAERRRINGKRCFELVEMDICRNNCIALQCLAKNGPVRMEEIRGKAPDGRELVLELSAMPVSGPQGQVTGVFVTHRDVTDERNLMTRYMGEQKENKSKVDALLKILQEREKELEGLRKKGRG
ncbi:PAS domain-containing protein [Myxococcota bacterium]